jgi:hypothetical protein
VQAKFNARALSHITYPSFQVAKYLFALDNPKLQRCRKWANVQLGVQTHFLEFPLDNAFGAGK